MQAESEDPPRLVAHTAFIRAAKPSTPEVVALAETARKASEDLGHPMPFAATGGVCDGNVIQQAGVPTIDTLGVRGGGMHRPDEHVQLESLVERATLFAILLHRLDRDGFGGRSGSGRSIS
jgi:glutamate carboxypeptidase